MNKIKEKSSNLIQEDRAAHAERIILKNAFIFLFSKNRL